MLLTPTSFNTIFLRSFSSLCLSHFNCAVGCSFSSFFCIRWHFSFMPLFSMCIKFCVRIGISPNDGSFYVSNRIEPMTQIFLKWERKCNKIRPWYKSNQMGFMAGTSFNIPRCEYEQKFRLYKKKLCGQSFSFGIDFLCVYFQCGNEMKIKWNVCLVLNWKSLMTTPYIVKIRTFTHNSQLIIYVPSRRKMNASREKKKNPNKILG